MGNTKFQVTISVDESKLGVILASLPPGIKPEITRMRARDEAALAIPQPKKIKKITGGRRAKKNMARTKRANKGKPVKGVLAEAMPLIMASLPHTFHSSAVRDLLPAHGLKPSSITYVLRKAIARKLIRRVKGAAAGNKVTYEHVAGAAAQ